MNWKNVKTSMPEDGSRIIQLDPPCEEYSYIGFRSFNKLAHERHVQYCIDEDMPQPDFWWTYESEFPFPKSDS